MTESESVAVCRIAWAEAYAAWSHRAREVPLDAPAIEAAKRAIARGVAVVVGGRVDRGR